MSLNPLNELKRRLNDDEVPLPKRLCLAKNVIQSHHFPSAPKERVIADWVQDLNQSKSLKGEALKTVLDWLNTCNDLGSELKFKLVQIVSEYIKTNPLQDSDLQFLISFIENDKIKIQLNSQIEEHLAVTITLLQYIKNNNDYALLRERIFNNLIRHYKESKKKLEFIDKLVNGENIEVLFSYLNTEYRNSVINVCNNILFPINKRNFFISYLQTLIRKDNLNELIAEKGDNIQSVLKIMNVLFEFPKGRTDLAIDFIKHFIDVFVSCYCKESQVIFAFYIMVANFLGLQQNYILPAINLPTVNLGSEKEEKTRRVLFLSMLEILLASEVDISVRLTDNFGVKISKVELNKSFILFLQEVMMNQLKLEGKPDKSTIEIINVALKLDPSLIERKMDKVLPPLMTAKKSNSKMSASYTDMLNCLLETLFKLSRGITFVNQILPNVKTSLEYSNTVQSERKKIINENNERIMSKIPMGIDIFPKECVEVYGKLTSELMFRQNKELLVLLQNDLEIHCLNMMEEGSANSSTITIAEFLSAILSSFLRHSKMADHTVPLPIAEDFWNVFKAFEEQYLRKFGECVLKLSHNSTLTIGFLNLCLNVAQLKLLNLKYSNVKVHMSIGDMSEVYDFSSVLPCLRREQWIELASGTNDDEAVLIMDNILLIKRTITELLALKDVNSNSNVNTKQTNTHFIERIATNPELLNNEYFSNALFNNLDSKQYKELAKILLKDYLDNPDRNIVKSNVLKNNRWLQNSLVLEVARNIAKCFENSDLLAKALAKIDFKIIDYAKDNNMRELFENLTLKSEFGDDTVKRYVELLGELQIAYLDENYQLVAIFLTLAIKKCCQSKKIKKNVNKILQTTYELSLLPPDLYQIFTTDYVFEFDMKTVLDLLTLKKSNNDLLIVKCLIESAVKRVKIDSNLVTSIVDILLKKKIKNNKSIDMFINPVFQISCIILPLIVKQKKIITASIHRSILADLQDKLQKVLLDSFKNIDFTQIGSVNNTGNIEDNLVENNTATLNAMAAYSLTLSRYCETTDAEEIRNLDCLWSGLEFFVQNAINSISDASSKPQHVESSIQLLNTTLRYIKKLETHEIFKEKDKVFIHIWQSLKCRLMFVLGDSSYTILEDIYVTLKYLCELCSVECFCGTFVGDIGTLSVLKKPTEILKDATTHEKSHKVAKFLLTQCLKANIIGPKCVAMTKLTYNNCRNLRFWLRQHYDEDSAANRKKRKYNIYNEDGVDEKKIVKIDESICSLVRINLDSLSEVILAAKKITLDYKYLDNIFELQHTLEHLMGLGSGLVKCEMTWQAFFVLYEGCVSILNSLIVSREEMLEDRWPCFMQCYRALVTLLCAKASAQNQLERCVEDKLAEIAHAIEKLTQSISKRKKHVSRISAYTVADICALIEKTPPTKNVRQHLENSIALLMQACDSNYAMSFLKRALAGSPGQVTVANMYLNYKRYHKYVGNA